MALRAPIVETEVHDMEFYILKYSLEGDYLGMEPLESQLFLCPHNIEDGKKMK